MQKRFLSLTAAVITAAILFSSCSKSNKQGRYIPATAGVVFHIDGKSLNDKLSWDEVKQNDLVKKMLADSTVPAFAKSVLNDPENSGMDIKKDLEIFLLKDSAGAYMGVEGVVKDEAKFKQFLSNAHKDAKESTKDGNSYLVNDKASIGYNKDMFIATVNLPQMDIKPQAMPTDSVFGGMDEVKYNRDMNAVTAQLFALKEDQSLAKNEKFSGLIGTTGDAHFWYNAQYFNYAGNMGAMAAMVNMDKITEGAISTGTISFDNGKINVDLKSYGGKDLTDLFKKYSGSSIDKAMIKNIPSKDLAGVFAFNFKPEGVKEFLKLMNMDGLANMGLAQMGFNLDDFVKANKGDILFAATDIRKDSMKGTTANYIFSASIGDKVAFSKLIDAGKKMGGTMMGQDGAQYGYNTNDKYFAISNNKAAAETYLAATANNSYSFLNNISGGPFGGYINFQYILNATMPAPGTDSLEMALYTTSLKMWDNLTISGGDFKDGGITQHWEINLMDKTTNSLKQLNTYAGMIAAFNEKRKAKMEAAWRSEDVINPRADSTMIK